MRQTHMTRLLTALYPGTLGHVLGIPSNVHRRSLRLWVARYAFVRCVCAPFKVADGSGTLPPNRQAVHHL